MLGGEQAHTPLPNAPPKSTTLDSRWAAHRGLGPKAAFSIEVDAFLRQKCGNVLNLVTRETVAFCTKTAPIRGAAAKTGVHPEVNIIL